MGKYCNIFQSSQRKFWNSSIGRGEKFTKFVPRWHGKKKITKFVSQLQKIVKFVSWSQEINCFQNFLYLVAIVLLNSSYFFFCNHLSALVRFFRDQLTKFAIYVCNSFDKNERFFPWSLFEFHDFLQSFDKFHVFCDRLMNFAIVWRILQSSPWQILQCFSRPWILVIFFLKIIWGISQFFPWDHLKKLVIFFPWQIIEIHCIFTRLTDGILKKNFCNHLAKFVIFFHGRLMEFATYFCDNLISLAIFSCNRSSNFTIFCDHITWRILRVFVIV